MKNILILIILTFSYSISFSQIVKADIIATGLTCSMCSNAINKKLKTIEGVDSVKTDLNTNTFSVYLNKDNHATPNTFKESVEKAGFYIGSLQILTPSKDVFNNTSFINLEKTSPKDKDIVTIKILDKGFVTDKEYKRLNKLYSKISTYNLENKNNYHFKIIN